MSSESASDQRKKTTTTIAQSILSRLSGASSSIRDRGSSMFLKFQREMLSLQEHDRIRFYEWLFAFTEFLLSFSWNCFLTREKSEHTFKMRDITPRQDTMETLFWIGFASLGNLAVGTLMDGFTGTYLMALFNVIMHFTLASFFLVGEVVYETSSEDVYVYCMDQVAGKGGAFIIQFTFIFNFFEILGNYLFNIVRDSTPSSALLAAIAFSFNGTTLFLFAYLLRPRPRLIPPVPRSVAIKVWKVVYTALKNKRKYKTKVQYQDWFDYAENKYDKLMITRTRRLFRVFLVASPTAGFLLFNSYQDVIFKTFYDNLKLSGADVPKYTKWMIYTSTILVVLIVEYAVFPALRACKFKVNFMKRFLIGYLSLLLGVLMATVLSADSEKITLRSTSGILRVFNTMQETKVTFKSMQKDFTDLGFAVGQRDAALANYVTNDRTLFRMEVSFTQLNTNTNATSYTQCFSVFPETVTQYVAINPSKIVPVPSELRIFEGPPGTNDRWKPRCFLTSFVDNQQTVLLIDDLSESQFTYNIKPGHVIVFQVPEGNYTFQYRDSISRKVHSTLRTGGLYGIYLFLSLNEYEIDVDKVIPENTHHALVALAVSIPMGIARGIGQVWYRFAAHAVQYLFEQQDMTIVPYMTVASKLSGSGSSRLSARTLIPVALDAFVYTTAPEGLKGTAMGFYTWILHLNAWFLLIGFHTWHHFITPDILVVYTLVASVSFVLCLVLLIRFRTYYTM